MDSTLEATTWRIIVASVRKAAHAIEPVGRRPVYPNWLIVAMFLWSVWHDRCLSWACDRNHYNTLFRPRGSLPSISQFTRRIKTHECHAILQRVHRDLAACGIAQDLSYIDGKPLLVSPVSKDPDAARGYITGGYGKGYKLHAYITARRRIVIWSVTPLNTDEKTVAREQLLPHLPPPRNPGGCLTLVDSNYDAAPLYKAFDRQGQALLAQVRAQHLVGPNGRHPTTLRMMGPQRREALAVWEQHPNLVRYVMEQRNNAEGVFSVLAMRFHLHALPGFVRRVERVRRWVGGKIILYHATLLALDHSTASAAA
jgi:hypothetical protein